MKLFLGEHCFSIMFFFPDDLSEELIWLEAEDLSLTTKLNFKYYNCKLYCLKFL